jgi:DNA (cytosine-5)-methyltransferase 1
MSKPVVYDAYCGAGGAGKGYDLAGYEVIGFDLADQPDYPFEFHKMNALSVIVATLTGALRPPALWHTSPPCQASCTLTKGTNKGRKYIDLIPATRELLLLTGIPFVIENVQGAKVRRDLTLCGETFGLGVLRHRYFELGNGAAATQPKHKEHRGLVRGWRHGVYQDGPYLAVYGEGGGKGTVAEWQQAMGIDWTDDRKAIAEAIPPAYTEYIGKQLIDTLAVAA